MDFPTHKIVVKTNSWPGNFTREMQSYVFGYSWDMSQGGDDSDVFIDDFPKDTDYFRWLDGETPQYMYYDEHGETMSDIVDDTTLEFYFLESPEEHWDTIVDRIKQFPKKCKEILKDDRFYGVPGDLKIEKIELVSIDVTYTKSFGIIL